VCSLLAGTTLTIDGRAGHGVGPTRSQHCAASHVQALLAYLHYATHDHIVDESGIEIVSLDQLLQDFRGKVDGMPVLQLAVPLTQRTADCIDNHCGVHVAYFSWFRSGVQSRFVH